MRAIDLGCPTCNRAGGQVCVRIGTNVPSGYFHAARVDAARALSPSKMACIWCKGESDMAFDNVCQDCHNLAITMPAPPYPTESSYGFFEWLNELIERRRTR